MASISFENLTKTYSVDGNPNTVIDGIDLEIESGEFTILVGPSGCGKSTVLRMIAGLEEISAGALRFDGKLVNDLSPSERGIGMVFQSYALYPHMSVAENIGFPLRMAGVKKREAQVSISEVAEMLELTEYLDSKPAQLSGGQRQRVAIGRALVRKPSVFLLDEPLSNLDASLRGRMRRSLAEYHRQLGCTVVYVTHDQREAMSLADRVVILRGGGIEQQGSPVDLYESPLTRFVAEFIGAPRINVIKAKVIGNDAHGLTMDVGGQTFLARASRDSSAITIAEDIDLGLRPENLQIVEDENSDFSVGGRVVRMEYMGGESLVFLDIPGTNTPLVVKCGPRVKVQPGRTVRVNYDPYNAYLFGHDGRAIERSASG